MKGGSPGAQTNDAYTGEGVTNELKSHHLVVLSKSERDAYPLVNLYLSARVIENLN